MANQIGPAPSYIPNRPHNNLPPDEVLMEQAVCAAIRDLFLSIPNLTDYAKVHARERFLSTDIEDIQETTVPDPVVAEKDITSVIQIGIPSVEEFEKTGDQHTQLNLVYPITYDLEVVDEWDNTDGALHYPNSRSLFMAVYMVSRRAFKNNRTFGYHNCVHYYLQQENAGTVEDDETGGQLHIADWSLTVSLTGVLV